MKKVILPARFKHECTNGCWVHFTSVKSFEGGAFSFSNSLNNTLGGIVEIPYAWNCAVLKEGDGGGWKVIQPKSFWKPTVKRKWKCFKLKSVLVKSLNPYRMALVKVVIFLTLKSIRNSQAVPLEFYLLVELNKRNSATSQLLELDIWSLILSNKFLKGILISLYRSRFNS